MNRRDCLLLISVLGMVTCLCYPAAGQQWPRFRGPNGAGQSEADTIPKTWSTPDYRWRVKLPGIGYSSAVVCGNRVFATCAIEQDATRILRCLDVSDGHMIWKRSFPSKTYSKHAFNSYAAGSPVVDRDRVYITWTTPGEYVVVALTQDKGRELWRRDLGPFVARHGFGSSPVLFDGAIILANDQEAPSDMYALDSATGAIRWKVPRRGSDKAAYSTPCILRAEGTAPQVILASTAYGIDSLDPYTGKTNWEIDVFKDRVVASPALAAGLIFASCGEGGGGKRMVAVKPGNPGKGIKPRVAYDIKGSLPYVPTSVARGNLLFLWSDSGVVTCLDAPTGKINWRERVGGGFFGSPVRVRDRLYCISRDGEMVVLAAADQYRLLARINLEEPGNSTPAIAGGVMYLRTRSHLMAISGE